MGDRFNGARQPDGEAGGRRLAAQAGDERSLQQLQSLLSQHRMEQERLAGLLGGVPAVVWEVTGRPDDPEQRFSYVSDYAETMLGYPLRDWLEQPAFWLSIVHAEDRERAAQEITASFASRGAGVSRFRWLASDGRTLWVETHTSAIYDEDDRPIGLRGVTLDITGRQRVEEALSAHETLQPTLVDTALDCLIATDAEGKILEWDAAAQQIFGYGRDETLGRRIEELIIPPALRERYRQELARALAPGEGLAPRRRIETGARRADGGEIQVELFIAPLEVGEQALLTCYVRDITERRRADAALAHSTNELRTIFESMTDAFIALDRSWRLTYINAEAERLLGLQRERHLGQDLWEVFPEAVETTFHREYQRAIAERRPVAFEEYYAPFAAWYEVRAYPSAVGLSIYFRDITERKQADAERRQLLAREREARGKAEAAEQRFRNLVDEVDAIVWESDAQSLQFSFVSRRAEEITGYPVERWVNEPGFWAELIHPDDRDWAVDYCLTAARAGRDHSFDYRVVTVDGRIVWLRDIVYVALDKDGRPDKLRGIMVDITERKRAEDSLRFLAEASTLFASSLDYELTLRSLSYMVLPRLGDWYAVFLVEEGSLLQPLVVAHKDPQQAELAQELLRRYPPDPHAPHGLAQVLRTGKPELIEHISDAVLRSIAADEEHLRLLQELQIRSWIIAPLLVRGRVLGAIALIRADSGQRYDREHLTLVEELARRAAVAIDNARLFSEAQSLNADLEHRVQERTAELEAALKELESFSYSVSHDLRAPLRSMDGFSLALLEDYGDQLDTEGRDYLQRVRSASQRMAQLIDDLLQLSRVTRSDLHWEPVDLSAMVHTTAESLRRQYPERQVALSVAEGLVAQGDPRLLQLALENLLDNAWKFTARCKEPRVEVGATQQDGKQVYFVRDNGAGFDMAYVDKLFGAFQRLHSDAEFQGSGIGLATVQRIIRRHGGQIWAEGAAERGATFYFTLKTIEERVHG